MRMRDLVPDFLTYWNAVKGADPAIQRERWERHYAARHPDVLTSYERHLIPVALEAALGRYSALAPLLPRRAERIRATVDRTTPVVLEVFGLNEPAWEWLTMVGACSADGWADFGNGTMTCYCAVESLLDDADFDVFVAHETAHAAHIAANPAIWDAAWTVGLGLFVEGMAVLASMRIAGCADEAVALWIGRAIQPNGDPTRAWVTACEAIWPELCAALRRDRRASDTAIYAAYFHGQPGSATIPIRAGYFAGLRLLRALNREATIAELARWSVARIETAVESFLA